MVKRFMEPVAAVSYTHLDVYKRQNEYRVKDALHLLTDKRYADKNVEEISAMVGFANRQSFYAAFYKNVGETPNGYRKKHAESKK